MSVECVDCASSPDRPARPRPVVAGIRKPRCATHHRARQRAQRAQAHESRVQKVYGLDAGEYAALLAYQGGTCAIPGCRASGKVKRLAVDHDHETGAVRGLLCTAHNYDLLGRFVGDLQAGLDYLADPPAARMRRERAA